MTASFWKDEVPSLLGRIRASLPVGFESELKNVVVLGVPATFGAGNLLRVGVIVQRTSLILLLTCFPCWALLVNTESILLLLGQQPEVARLSQLYVKIFMPALPATFMYQLQSGYLQNQGVIWPQVMTGVAANLLNVYVNYVVVFVFHTGVVGSALANVVSQFSMAGILFAYILWKGLHKRTWGGWSRDCLEGWGPFIRLALPSLLMMCVEWWTFEISVFLAGLISEAELGAQSIVYQLSNCAYMFPLGFSQAGAVRVGNALGAGDTQLAKLAAKLAIFCAALVSLCLAIVIGSLRHQIAFVFTYDEQIRVRVAEVLMFYAPFILMEAILAATGGIVRGTGKQKIGALCNILGYYGLCLPLGVPLMFKTKLGIKGLWTGFCASASVQCCFLVIYLAKMNWDKVTLEAQMRAGVAGSSEDPQQESDSYELLVLKEEEDQEEEEEEEAAPAAAVRAPDQYLVRRGLVVALMLAVTVAGIVADRLLTKRLN
ncbi:multidrug and toxin extrusion protein 1-like isoform X2 [Syngnathoides biaculeatus]|uniref:multidrug and toxin extrusion protein 1-like isoform X2 n=1 Tax=Syngnathoides biaculeatus TaxID=300417 RepID=UPI002ADDD3DF|nr:multidrug and toxin extrusion protein 1-like isoform X2 [Syngnathoides biaculeatus]